MAYNNGRENRKWLIWKEDEKKYCGSMDLIKTPLSKSAQMTKPVGLWTRTRRQSSAGYFHSVCRGKESPPLPNALVNLGDAKVYAKTFSIGVIKEYKNRSDPITESNLMLL